MDSPLPKKNRTGITEELSLTELLATETSGDIVIDPAKLLQLIAAKPQIRTMELAEKLDCEIDEMDASLASPFDAGTIVAVPVTAPNGRAATGYRLSDAARAEQARVSQPVITTIDRAVAIITEWSMVRGGRTAFPPGLRANDWYRASSRRRLLTGACW